MKINLTFPRTMVLKSNLLLPYSFVGRYEVGDVGILSKGINFSLGGKYFRNIDTRELGIKVEKVFDNGKG